MFCGVKRLTAGAGPSKRCAAQLCSIEGRRARYVPDRQVTRWCFAGTHGQVSTAACVAAMGGSHPVAKRVGAWPAVTGVTVAAAGPSPAPPGR
jgi:hypothetical protein